VSLQPNGIFLIDDNSDDNFFHQREIKKVFPDTCLSVFNSASEALAFLKSTIREKKNLPELIFLDINMPVMNGWEFLEQVGRLGEIRNDTLIFIMHLPFDIFEEKTRVIPGISPEYIEKPLTKDKLAEIFRNL
jgi:two-component SAPR family response regulator